MRIAGPIMVLFGFGLIFLVYYINWIVVMPSLGLLNALFALYLFIQITFNYTMAVLTSNEQQEPLLDDHCPWLNNCVGANNHLYFYLMLLYLTIGCFYFCIVGFSSFEGILYRRFDNGIAIFGLLGLHTYLIASGQTTLEYSMQHFYKEMGHISGERYFNDLCGCS
ncbi:hypothetical protein EDD86DRAFT_245731 [Gorgonomyces haynaldii]|nr:hypothetical protein EDD86DRAFT_245731 [Gorgonomyces haynaldii]